MKIFTNLVGASCSKTVERPATAAVVRKATGINTRAHQPIHFAVDTAARFPQALKAHGMALGALLLPVRPTAKFMASEIPASLSAVIVGALAPSGAATIKTSLKLDPTKKRRRLTLADVVPVCNDLSERPARIPSGALIRLNPGLLALSTGRLS